MPNANSVFSGILVVGERDNVTKAVSYINKTVERALDRVAQSKQEREEREASYSEMREQARAEAEQADMEPWMLNYVKDKSSSNVLDLDTAFPAVS
jgi:hypothetical protein